MCQHGVGVCTFATDGRLEINLRQIVESVDVIFPSPIRPVRVVAKATKQLDWEQYWLCSRVHVSQTRNCLSFSRSHFSEFYHFSVDEKKPGLTHEIVGRFFFWAPVDVLATVCVISVRFFGGPTPSDALPEAGASVGGGSTGVTLLRQQLLNRQTELAFKVLDTEFQVNVPFSVVDQPTGFTVQNEFE